jgi:DNA-binding LytR/AlgR family response regulator
MNIVIIEDEKNIAWDLKNSIERLRPASVVHQVLDSVKAGKEWFELHPMPDLIFSDIQLCDGIAFDIFRNLRLSCPVIFCTAFDEYAIDAFRHNAIDYLLKPIDEKALQQSLAKIEMFRQNKDSVIDPAALSNALQAIAQQRQPFKQSLLVVHRDKLIPVPVSTVAYFQLQHESLRLYTNDNHAWLINDSLDHLEQLLDPARFYRANRQTLVSYPAIKEIELYADRKLLVHLTIRSNEPIIVSKARATDFIHWMESH